MLKKESTSVMNHRPVTLKDVEEGAVNLRKVGEALATLKGDYIYIFPACRLSFSKRRWYTTVGVSKIYIYSLYFIIISHLFIVFLLFII